MPLCARLSFFRLYSGFEVWNVADLVGQRVPFAGDPTGTKRDWDKTVKHGYAAGGGMYVVEDRGNPLKRETAVIVMDPAHFKTRKRYVDNPSRPKKSPAITGPRVRLGWPTPRTGGITHSHNLSERTMLDISTVAIYARSVDGVPHRKTDDSDRLNPRFVEWLMGYPMDHTKLR